MHRHGGNPIVGARWLTEFANRHLRKPTVQYSVIPTPRCNLGLLGKLLPYDAALH